MRSQPQRPCSRRHLILVPLLAALAWHPAQAQTAAYRDTGMRVTCEGPLQSNGNDPTCRGSVAPADSLQRYELHVRLTTADGAPVPGARVRLGTTSGALLPDTTRSDDQGNVRTTWYRNQGADLVGIALEAEGGGTTTLRFIELQPRKSAEQTLVLRPVRPFPAAGFENTPIRRPMIVEIRRLAGQEPADTTTAPLTEPAECQKQRVAFSRYGSIGAITPDTALPLFVGAGKTASLADDWVTGSVGCFAEAHLTLGERPGVRLTRAALVPASGYRSAEPPIITSTRARSTPRFVLAAGVRYDRSFAVRDEGTARVLKVERPLEDGGKMVYDSTVPGTISLDSTDHVNSGVMVGFTSAIIPELNRLQVTAGVGFDTPKDDWYLGLSVSRLLGFWGEAFPVDMHLLSHWGRVHEVGDPARCVAGTGEDPCGTRTRPALKGAAFMLSVDAGTLVTEAIRKIGS